MPKFRKKPIVIEAEEFLGQKHPAICRCEMPKNWHIHTLEGQMEIKCNDWLIKGVAGEFYPCHPDIFRATYESVEEADGST